MMHRRRNQQEGFTILELMIATTIVSVILLMVTTVMIGLQSLYYKGVNQENIQDNVRTIADQIDQEIQTSIGNPAVAWVSPPPYPSFTADFNGTPGQYQVNALCIGSVRYVYIIGLQVGTGNNQVAQALWRDTTPDGGCDATLPPNIQTTTPSDGGTAYVASGARLTSFNISQLSDGNYQLQVSVAIGPDNHLTNVGPSGNYDARCNGSSGDQFCATASLTTEVGQRLD